MTSLPVRNVRRFPVAPSDMGKGVRAWLSFEYGSLRIDGVALADGGRRPQAPDRPAR